MKSGITALLLITGIAAGTLTLPGSEPGSADYQEADIDVIASEITEAVADYYYSKDVFGEFDAAEIYSDDVAAYLADKVKSQQLVTDINGTDKENYDVDVTLAASDVNMDSGVASFEFQVLSRYNYARADCETSSGEVVKVKFDLQRNEIIDVYTPLNYYDEFIRAGMNSGDTDSEFRLTPSIKARQEELARRISGS